MKNAVSVVFSCGAVFALLSVVNPACAGANFTLDGVEQTFEEVAAFRIRDQRNADRMSTLVVFTKSPVNIDAALEARDPYGYLINDPATDSDWIGLFVDAEGEIGMNASMSGVQYLDTTGEIMDEPGSLSGTCATNSETQIVCTVRSPESVQSAGGKTWSFAAEFDQKVHQRAKGKALPKGGGEAGAALTELAAALAKDDLEAILIHLSDERAQEYREDDRPEAERLAAVKSFMEMQAPRSPKVVGGEMVSDDEVRLEVHGKMDGVDKDLLYEVTMRRGDSGWYYDSASILGLVQ